MCEICFHKRWQMCSKTVWHWYSLYIANCEYSTHSCMRVDNGCQNCLMCFLYRHSLTFAVVTFRKVQHQSHSSQVGTKYTYGQLYMYIQRSISEIQIPVQWNIVSCSVPSPPPGIIAKWYSVTLISLCSHSHKETFGAHLKNAVIPVFKFF